MKKSLIKKLLIASCISLLILTSVITVNAGGSGYVSAPATTAGTFTSTSPAYACYSAANTAKGSNSYTYFRNYGTLQSSFADNSSRTIDIRLVEDDIWFNDEVKTYTGSFSGRTLSSITLTSTVISGDIEPSGDNCAELFIRFNVQKVTGDPSTPSIASGLFQYSVGMN